MILLGYLLITAGFVGGSLFAVQQVETVQWGAWAAAMAIGAGGVALVRAGRHKLTRSSDLLEGNLETLKESLQSLVDKVAAFAAEGTNTDPYAARHRIDDELMADLNAFVQARESVQHRYDVQAYADVMTPFATAERYLNRVWSASVDGYIDEVAEYLGRAEAQLREAKGVLEGLGAETRL